MTKTENQTRKEIIDVRLSKSINLFIKEYTYLSSQQLEFLNILRDYIIVRSGAQKKVLNRAPFTAMHPKGILGVFSGSETDEIVQLTESLVA